MKQFNENKPFFFLKLFLSINGVLLPVFTGWVHECCVCATCDLGKKTEKENVLFSVEKTKNIGLG